MVDRLANVIYWSCTVVAILCIGFGVVGTVLEPGSSRFWIIGTMGFLGVAIWLIGRGIRYILSGI